MRSMDDLDRQVLQGLDAAVLLVGGQGEVLFANGKAACALGRDLTGARLLDEDLEGDSPLVSGVAESYRRARGARETWRDLLIATSEDAVHYYWVTVSDPGSEVAGDARVLMLQDISEPLTGAAAIRRVFSQVNHDLRNPLTSIAGAAELLLSGRVGAVEGVQRRLLRIVEEGTQKMSAILASTKSDLTHEEQAAGGERGE